MTPRAWVATGAALSALTACSLPSNLREPIVPGQDAAAMDAASEAAAPPTDAPSPGMDVAPPRDAGPDAVPPPADAGPADVAPPPADAPPSCTGNPGRPTLLAPVQGAALVANGATFVVRVSNADSVEITVAGSVAALATAAPINVPVVGGMASRAVPFLDADRNQGRVWRVVARCGATAGVPVFSSFRLGSRAPAGWQPNAFERIEFDANADGRADLAASGGIASSVTSGAGVYVFLAGASSVQAVMGSTVAQDYRDSFAAIGDINGNGTGDFLVGYGSRSGGGAVSIYDGEISGVGTFVNLAPVTASGAVPSQLGRAAVALGDITGDGRADFAIADFDKVFIISGSSVAANAMRIPAMSFIDVGSSLGGISALAAGDFNADGAIDIAVGAANANSGEGRVLLYQGGGGMFPSMPTRVISAPSTRAFGIALAVGAVRNDGAVDLIASGIGNTPMSLVGRAFVFHQPFNAAVTPIGLVPTSFSPVASSQYGSAVSCAGDADADGLSEVLVVANTQRSANGIGAAALFEATSDTVAAEVLSIAPQTGEDFVGAVAAIGNFTANALSFAIGNPTALVSGVTTGAVQIKPYGVTAATGPLVPFRPPILPSLPTTARGVGDHIAGE